MPKSISTSYEVMIDFEHAFLDSSFFIYHLEKNSSYAETTTAFLYHSQEKNKRLSTSVISALEYSVKPYEINNPKLIRGFQDFLLENDIPVYNIDYEVADNAARLRGNYKFLKGLDALQIASALDHSCDLFVTNDSQLRAIREITVVLMDELAKELS